MTAPVPVPTGRWMAPLTYWVWRTVCKHGPVSSDRLRELLPRMSPKLLSNRLYNLRRRGYLDSAAQPGQKWAVFTSTRLLPPSQAELERALLADPVYQGGREIERDRWSEPRPKKHAPAPACAGPVVPPRQVELQQPWTEPYLATRPARAGAMDFAACPSRRFGERVIVPHKLCPGGR